MFSQQFPARIDPRLSTGGSGLTAAATDAQFSRLAADRYALLQAAAEREAGQRHPRIRAFAKLRTFRAQRVTS